MGPSVVKWRIRYGSAETTVPAVNGTFQAALGAPYAELLGTVTSTVRAYDSAGRVVSASHPLDQWSMREQLRTCWVAPDGSVVVPARATPSPGRASLRCAGADCRSAASGGDGGAAGRRLGRRPRSATGRT